MRQRAREAAAITLLEAAEEVAAHRGLESTSIAAIAEGAGVAVGTLYNYFADRDALLAALFKLRRGQMLPRIAAAAEEAAGLPFEERLRSYLTAVLGAFEDHRRFCRVAMAAADQGAMKAKIGRTSAVLTTIIESLREILAARPTDDGAPHDPSVTFDLAYLLFGALKGVLHTRLERDLPLAPAADLLADTFLRGILSSPARPR